MLESQDSNWANGVRSGAWIGLNSDLEGNLSFADGEQLDADYKSPYGDLKLITLKNTEIIIQDLDIIY